MDSMVDLESRLWVIKTLKRILSDYWYKIVIRLEFLEFNEGVLSNSALFCKVAVFDETVSSCIKLRLIAAKSCFEAKHSQYTQWVYTCIIEAVVL